MTAADERERVAQLEVEVAQLRAERDELLERCERLTTTLRVTANSCRTLAQSAERALTTP